MKYNLTKRIAQLLMVVIMLLGILVGSLPFTDTHHPSLFLKIMFVLIFGVYEVAIIGVIWAIEKSDFPDDTFC